MNEVTFADARFADWVTEGLPLHIALHAIWFTTSAPWMVVQDVWFEVES
jgi:hypothetical protein